MRRGQEGIVIDASERFRQPNHSARHALAPLGQRGLAEVIQLLPEGNEPSIKVIGSPEAIVELSVGNVIAQVRALGHIKAADALTNLCLQAAKDSKDIMTVQDVAAEFLIEAHILPALGPIA